MRIGVSILLFISLLFACTNENDSKEAISQSKKSWQKEAVSFLSNQDELLAFGSIKIDLLLKKIIKDSDLGSSGLMPMSMIDDYTDCIDTKYPIYYAVRDSKQSSNNPEAIVFGKIIDADALVETIKLDAPFLQIEKEGGFKYLLEGELKIAINERYFVAIMNDEESKKASKKKLNQIFKELNSKQNNQDIDDIFSHSKDLTFAINSAAMSNYSAKMMGSSLSQIDEDFNALVAINLSFDKGSIKVSGKNYPSKEMESWNIFRKDSKTLLSTLGSGNPVGAIAMNIDIEAYERLQKKYFPQSIANTIQDSGLDDVLKDYIPDNLAVIEALIKKEGMTSFINGGFSAAVYADDGIHSEYSLHLGIGSSLRPILADELDYYKDLFYQFDLNDNKLSIYSSENNGPQSQNTPLTIAKRFNTFGNDPVSGFIDLERLPLEGMIPDYADPFMAILSNCIFNASMKEGVFILNMKNKEINSLTQICNQIPKLIMGSIL